MPRPAPCWQRRTSTGWGGSITRVWNPVGSNNSSVQQVQLVSLGHPEIAGLLAARVSDVYIEFRTNDAWDAGLARPAVLIHEMVGTNAVIIASDPAHYVNDWQPGQRYGPDDTGLSVFGGTAVTIESFDLNAHTATITVKHVAKRPLISGGGVRVFGGIAVDGGGFIVTPSGKIIHVPPHSPLIKILDEVATASTAAERLSPKAQKKIHTTALRHIAKLTKKGKAISKTKAKSRG